MKHIVEYFLCYKDNKIYRIYDNTLFCHGKIRLLVGRIILNITYVVMIFTFVTIGSTLLLMKRQMILKNIIMKKIYVNINYTNNICSLK